MRSIADELRRRAVFDSVEALVSGATERVALVHSDSKSGATIERVVVDGRSMVMKRLDHREDWTLRAVGDIGVVAVEVWARGLLDAMPPCFAQPVIGAARERAADGHQVGALLMEDVGDALVPSGDELLPLEQHVRFIEHLATMHAHFWEGDESIDLATPMNRFLELSPWMAEAEKALGEAHLVPRLVGEGWDRLSEVAPAMARIVVPLAWDPARLVDALATTPSTFVHGNWKFGNLGSLPDGRTVLIDWENPGRGSGCAELGWYLAINSARLPCSKEDTMEHYRHALERCGISTKGWWERQLRLGMLAGCVWFGWEKALGGWGDELAWWAEQASRSVEYLP